MADRTPIIVAAIGLLGTITVGLLANADKLRGLFGHAPVAVQPPATPPVDTGAHQNPASAPVEPSDAMPSATASGEGTARSLTGIWVSDDGYRFRFHQSGNVFSYAATENGADRGTGDGTIRGRQLTYGFTSPGGSGVCSATMSADGDSVTGRCHMGDTPNRRWDMSIRRVS